MARIQNDRPVKAAAAFLCLLLPAAAGAAPLAKRIEQLLASSPAAQAAFWGIEVIDLGSGKTLAEHNAEHFFIPASNTKLFTTSLALTRLGADYTFQTRVVADAAPGADGSIAGDVRLVGGGDPNLSPRPVPFRQGPYTGDPLAAIEQLADQVAARGVKRIEGNIVGDDTWYVWEPYASGWSIDDPRSADGAPISALTVDDNALTLHLSPGAEAGSPAALKLDPPVEYYSLDNRVHTAPAGQPRRIRIDRVPGSMELRLWGTIPLRDRGEDLDLGIEDPALFAAQALRVLLEQRGITVSGSAVARHLYAHEVPDLAQAPAVAPDPSTELARHVSAPLLEDLRITDKVSQNLHAELALRAVARARRNIGSFEAAREELRAFLTEAGVAAGGYTLYDGSGLSRLDLATPATVVQLLRYMYDSPQRANWISLLPVGGQDGTLNSRFSGSPAAGHIHAKTGSLSHVSALSGYLERTGGRWLAFSVLVNNYNGPASEIHDAMDRICALLMER